MISTVTSRTPVLPRVLSAAALAVALVTAPMRAPADDAQVRVDVPVKLESANVVFNMAHLSLQGDLPVGLKYLRLASKRFRDTGVKGHIVAIFHSEAGYLTLSDRAYNAYRNVSTGNPYKQILAELAAGGVELEECAATMRDHGWTNDDLLPGVKVDGGAISRLIQLTQQGYVQLVP